jgi:hypothetical protein
MTSRWLLVSGFLASPATIVTTMTTTDQHLARFLVHAILTASDFDLSLPSQTLLVSSRSRSHRITHSNHNNHRNHPGIIKTDTLAIFYEEWHYHNLTHDTRLHSKRKTSSRYYTTIVLFG